ncbi:uncharacterized protein YbjT (DUF2867 family) [Plantactinospora soyae]|uniref:Uncharacterized protein YbjT (DUF2867 family) n=1 Tax=Plantactinospora soyae TaxID=1544732 RepID=A0A927M8U2_9ACTN|nr:uncharacterized protein YbjT (DUF2867 family) [Plantactinospora soyae]
MTTERVTILVTGATGNIGRHVVRGLLTAGVAVRALVRDPGAAELPDGVELVRGDLTRPAELAAALAGVDAVFLLWPFPTAEGAAPVLDVIAAHAGHVVYVSSMSVRDDQEPALNGVWGEIEQLIEKSGLTWTFLRPGGFATNTLEWAGQIRADATVRWVYGGAGRSLIHERDIAEVAVRALTGPEHLGMRYVLTGPEVLTQEEQVRIIGEVIGRPVRWLEIPVAQARQILVDVWANADFVDGAFGYWATLVTDPEPVTRTVEEVTAVPARSFRDWAVDHADEFRPLSVPQVADRYVSLIRKGRFDLVGQLMAPDVLRVAPMETGGAPVELRGMTSIMDNSRRLTADTEIHRVEVDGPYLRGDRFAVRFTFDETHLPTGVRGTTSKMSLYTVSGGLIGREEVYYLDPPRMFGQQGRGD